MRLQNGIREIHDLVPIPQIFPKNEIRHHLQLPFRDRGALADAVQGKSFLLPALIGSRVKGAVALIRCRCFAILPAPALAVELMPAGADQELSPHGRDRQFAVFAATVAGQVSAFAFHNHLHPFKFFFCDDRLMGTPHLELRNHAAVRDLFLLQIVRSVLFVVGHDPAVKRVLQDMRDHCHMPMLQAGRGRDVPQLQLVLDFGEPPSVQIPVKDHAHDLCLLGIDHHPLPHAVVAEDIPGAVYHTVFHRGLLTALHAD